MTDTISSVARMLEAGRGHEWSRFEHMDCYIRVGCRWSEKDKLELSIQLANLVCEAEYHRTGTFTRLVESLRARWPEVPLFLENVLDPEWASVLVERHGWVRATTPMCLVLR